MRTKTRRRCKQMTQLFNQYSENEAKVWRQNILNQFNSMSSSCLRSHVVISLFKKSLRQGGLRCCSPENGCLHVEEKLEQNFNQETADSDSDDDSSCSQGSIYSGAGESFPQTSQLPPKTFFIKKLKAISNTDLI